MVDGKLQIKDENLDRPVRVCITYWRVTQSNSQAIMALYEHPSNSQSGPSHITGSMIKITMAEPIFVPKEFTVIYTPLNGQEETKTVKLMKLRDVSGMASCRARIGDGTRVRWRWGYLTRFGV